MQIVELLEENTPRQLERVRSRARRVALMLTAERLGSNFQANPNGAER